MILYVSTFFSLLAPEVNKTVFIIVPNFLLSITNDAGLWCNHWFTQELKEANSVRGLHTQELKEANSVVVLQRVTVAVNSLYCGLLLLLLQYYLATDVKLRSQ